MSDQSTNFARTRNPYGSRKVKRHLCLTDYSYGVLVDLATDSGLNPSEVNEQLIRLHALSRGFPYSEHNPLITTPPEGS
jgi:hypothetical protein